jgi:hypothetical protein
MEKNKCYYEVKEGHHRYPVQNAIDEKYLETMQVIWNTRLQLIKEIDEEDRIQIGELRKKSVETN